MTREEIKNQMARDFHNDYSLRRDVVSMYEDAIFYVDKIFNDFENRNCNNCKHYSIKEGHQPDGMMWKFEECAIYSALVPELLDYEGCTKWECEDD